MKKILAIVFLAMFFASTGVSSVSSELFVLNSTVTGGQMNEVANFELTASGNDSLTDVKPAVSVEASSNVVPENIENISNSSQNFTLRISPDKSFDAGNYSTDFKLISAEQTFEQSLDYEIPVDNDWNITPKEASKDISSGDEGVLETFTLFQNGNKQTEVETSISGNISSYLDPIPPKNIYTTTNSTIELKYNTGISLNPGIYNGTMNVSEIGTSELRQVNLSLNVSDNQSPEFGLSEFNDIEATLSEEFKMKVNDNIGVEKVTGQVVTEKNVSTGNNTSELRNKTVTSIEFEETGESVYSYDYSKTNNTGEFFVKLTAEDTSGNTESSTESFEITDLESLILEKDTVGLDTIVSGQEKRVEAFEIEDKTPVNVSLDGVTPENASIDIGIRGQDDDATRMMGDEGYVFLEEPGTYFLEATPQTGESSYRFNGKLSFDLVKQHVDVSDLYFEGKAILDYPEPNNVTSNGLQAQAYYVYDANGDPDKVIRKTMRDASICRGLSTIDECAGKIDINKIEDQGETISGLKGQIDVYKYSMLFMGFLFVGYIGLSRKRSRLEGLTKVQYQMDYGFSNDVPGSTVSKWNPEDYLKGKNLQEDDNEWSQ